MKKELRKKIIAYNKQAKENSEKATDMDILIGAIAKLPWGQLKKLLSDEVLEVLAKYGFKV